jgi:Uma2 family endonuclease
MGSTPVKIGATEADWDALPEGTTAELIDGDLYVHATPRPRHQIVITRFVGELLPSTRDRSPKGWHILFEAGIRFGKNRILVPDLAGWRRERMPKIPDDDWKIAIIPDWVCEGISPSTARLDRGRKREIYAAMKVGHIWFADSAARTVEILQLDGKSYRVIATAGGDERGRFAPFDHEIDLAVLWADIDYKDDDH